MVKCDMSDLKIDDGSVITYNTYRGIEYAYVNPYYGNHCMPLIWPLDLYMGIINYQDLSYHSRYHYIAKLLPFEVTEIKKRISGHNHGSTLELSKDLPEIHSYNWEAEMKKSIPEDWILYSSNNVAIPGATEDLDRMCQMIIYRKDTFTDRPFQFAIPQSVDNNHDAEYSDAMSEF